VHRHARPGATNLTTGVGSAWLDRSPLIAITCTLNEAQLGRRLQMWIDHHALFKPITKGTFRLRRGEIVATLTQALQLALSEPQGPVHLDLPETLRWRKSQRHSPSDRGNAGRAGAGPLGANPETSIAQAGAMLRAARRPVAVIGASAMRMQNPQALLAFVERQHMPFATTTMAKA